MGRSALLVANRSKPEVVRALPEVRAIIERHTEVVGEVGLDEPIGAGASKAGLVVVLGGDGTLISQARKFVDMRLPLLGLNFGKLGFLAEFDIEAFRRQAGTLLGDGELPLRERMLIEAEARSEGAYPTAPPKFSGLAVNECVITAGPPYRMIDLEISIDGETGPRLNGDGVIVSTPLGSTAYNVSAGGPIVSPDVRAMIIMPLAAHSLSFRPIVLSHASRIEVRVARANRPQSPADAWGTSLVLDGQLSAPLSQGDVVALRKHEKPALFVINRETNHWRTLMRTMHWAATPGPRSDGLGSVGESRPG